MSDHRKTQEQLGETVRKLLYLVVFLLLAIIALSALLIFGIPEFSSQKVSSPAVSTHPVLTPGQSSLKAANEFTGLWQAPDTTQLINHPDQEKILYGKQLIVNTAYYLGPKGKVMHISNGMNCQNCHLNAGTKPFGSNFGAVKATYPKFRERSGTVEDLYKRINDCLERSLNGKKLDTSNPEMRAMKAYIEWLGEGVEKDLKPKGSGMFQVVYMNRAANPENGKVLYSQKCQSCHQADGQGLKNTGGTSWQYPPLWGDHSYNSGAGIYRLSHFAGFIKCNMPLGATVENPLLTDEEAWDIAAFVNSQTRPSFNISNDWPDISKKPVDHPFGPFADTFTTRQHKYGPFHPIADQRQAQAKK